MTNQLNDDVIQRIGHLTRMLRVSMQELGLGKEIEKAAQAIPDAKDRLSYVATMTEQAANRVLSSIERVSPKQKALQRDAEALIVRVEEAKSAGSSADLLSDISTYLQTAGATSAEMQKELQEITMAQDFQDLTGQVIKKLMEVVREIEHQLVQVLLESSHDASGDDVLKRLAASEWNEEKQDSLLNGPQIKPTEGDAVSGQDQVDTLLDELGF